ncbi:ribonuclease D [Pasteurella skyensis]|uniref:Ribonuclease D n=1 Tax=Phocoenobacter skyensis TaxID=97481 RepID=A0AAJ6N9H0_9PAST|nr:ribonuclease D [Pasteurella skyensis]MDP8162224.1 ribonuclease D [Pasteurella skyensis]MDP8172688.1 ribonuclease D [Pasteurella skyensis]MDP8179188.1 ribonuclease D [Pasteurella skyensis]MDP8183357.1 ribonuclease D [Pasteurella skyensis]MDP8189004.1 ribonuclease D [Pasteurella skyensis]
MNNIDYRWIESNSSLLEACQQISLQHTVMLDTEFVRTRTFYPKLGLIQLFDGKTVYLIDPLAIDDFTPFIELLANKGVIKVLHACSEDLEVFQHYFNQMPQPMLDTQIMAAFLGLGTSTGFAKLVQHYLNIELDKGASRTNWLKRPLSDVQLQYAAADVRYLLPVYQRLREQFELSPWQEAIREECQTEIEKHTQSVDPNNLYKKIPNAWRLEPQQLAVLQLLAKWRYEEAQKRDLALNFVVKADCLSQIAELQPKHTSVLLEFMHPNEVRIHGKKILKLVEQGKAILPENYPSKVTRLVDEEGYKQTMKALQQKLKQICPDNLEQGLLASKRQLNQLFKWIKKGENPQHLPELLKGWRTEFGKKLQKVVTM